MKIEVRPRMIHLFIFVHEDVHNYSLMKPDFCFLCESPALQDYSNKAPG